MKREEKKIIAKKAEEILEKTYPDAVCSLEYSTPFELLIATRLSAQCTDKRVNIVTKELFKKFKNPEDYKNASVEEIAEVIKTCGLYKQKAKDIKGMATLLIDKFSGVLPETLEELLEFPGVGRKTANLIMGDIYLKPAVVTDTHFIRITGRLGLTKNTEPYKVEKDLIKLLTPESSASFCHRIVLFGREYCSARNPKCSVCPMRENCVYIKEKKNG
jgi:endonuclease-3